MSIWGITDGSAGMVAQVKALAAALDMPLEMKTVSLKVPYVWLPNAVHAALWPRRIFPGLLAEGAEMLCAPWPKLVVSCGRKGALAALGLRQQTPRATPLYVHIQDPQVHPRWFDVVIAMEHDRLQADNVISTSMALHSVTAAYLAQGRQHWASRFEALPSPRIGVLIGGSTNKYTLKTRAMQSLIAQLQQVLASSGGSLMMTASRRTGEANLELLRQAFADQPRCDLYDFSGDNPYAGILAWADHLIVSNDSVNMMTEAQATGKPLHILPLAGHTSTKPARFAEMLVAQGRARWLAAPLQAWSYTPGDEMEKIRHKLELKLANAVW